MPAPNVVICGAGIAGSVFAWWLLRAFPDARITIVERAPGLRLSEASVDIRSSAVDIIKLMGLEAEIRKHTTEEEGVQFVHSDGSAVATFGATGSTDVQSMTSEFEIFRGALVRIFMEPVMDKADLIFNESIEGYEQDEDGVHVTFATGKQTKTYDLLVAADGLGSKIRGRMLNTRPREQISGPRSHCAYFTIKKDLLQGGRLAKLYNATNGRVVFIRPDPDPEGRTRGNLMNVTTTDAVKARLDEAMEQGNEAYKKLMVELFTDAGWITPEVLQGMQESDDFYCSIFAEVASPKLCDGRVVLLGDAGHATPGFGTSLAIMGGYVMAGEILNGPGDVRSAVKRYEDLMLPFAKSSQQGNSAATVLRWMIPQSRWGLGIRNAVMTFVTSLGLDRLIISGAAALGVSNPKLKMPDYPWPEP